MRCQIELRAAERGQEAADKPKRAGNPTGLSSPGQEKIKKNIQRLSRRPSRLPDKLCEGAAERPPPPHIAYPEVLVAAETSGEYFS
jgi:hypothetical protein